MSGGAPRPWGRLAVRERLQALLPDTPEPDDDLPDRRGAAILLSLVVASVLWFSFSMRKPYVDTLEVPVEVVSTPAGIALSAPPPTSATVTLQGEGWTLLGLSRRRPVIRVSPDGPTVDLAAMLGEAGLPADVVVQAVQPRTVELAFDTRTSRRLPIRLRSRIVPEPDYDLLAAPRLQPDSISVTGAQSLLGSLTDWPTDMMVVEDVRDSFQRRVALSDTFGGLLVPSVRSTIVAVDVATFTEESRDLDIRTVNVPSGIEGVRYEPRRVTVEYRIPLSSDDYERARVTDDFYAEVDYADILSDTTAGQVPVRARWPEGLDIRDVRLGDTRVEYFIQQRRPAAPVFPEEAP
ncbi:MAG: hypothetical protein AAF845_00965 [Bacteroidota bacterium]